MNNTKKRIKRMFHLEAKFTTMYTVILIVVICCIACSIGLYSQKVLKRNAKELCNQKLTLVNDRFSQILDRIENETLLLTLNQAARYESAKSSGISAYEEYRNSNDFSSYLAEFLATQSAVEAIGYYSKDETFLYQDTYAKSQIAPEQIPLQIRKNFLESKNNARWYLHMPSDPQFQSNLTMTCLRKAYAFSGELTGFFALTVSPAQIQSLYTDIFDPSEIFFLWDQSGLISASTDPRLPSRSVETALVACDTSSYLLVSQPVRSTGFSLSVLTPERMIYRDSRNLVVMIILIGFITSATTLALYRYSTHRLLLPLKKIIQTVHQISGGNYGCRIQTGTSVDEISLLADQINIMACNTQDLLLRVQEENDQKRKFELSCLHLQMQPHFLYNTLETLCGMIELNDKEDAIALIHQISTFYRATLNKGKEIITIRQELSITNSYLSIMQKRYPGCFRFSCHMDPELLDATIPKLTLQPLVENSIIHGLNLFLYDNSGLISISGYKEDSRLFIQVSDNGAGMDPETVKQMNLHIFSEETKSFGMISLEKRLRLYDPGAFILINSQPEKGTTVTICLTRLTQEGENYDVSIFNC